MNELLTTFDLDGDSLAYLINICTKDGLTPSQVVSQMIREKAMQEGLIAATA